MSFLTCGCQNTVSFWATSFSWLLIACYKWHVLWCFTAAVCFQWLSLHLHLFSMLSSAYRNPRLHSYPMSTHLMMPSRALLPQQRRAPPPKRSNLLLRRPRLWLHQRLMQKHPSSRTRPISCMRGAALVIATPPASCLIRKLNINNQRLITAQVTQLFSWPTFHQTCRASAAATPFLSSLYQ